MSFGWNGCWFNLVDTPGHADFSEDTYRTLTAVDAAIMVIDGAKGVEPSALGIAGSAPSSTSNRIRSVSPVCAARK